MLITRFYFMKQNAETSFEGALQIDKQSRLAIAGPIRHTGCLSLKENQAQRRPVRNDQHCYQQHDHKGYGSLVEFCDGFIEAVAGNEQVHPHRRREVADLHVGQKNDAQMNRVDPVIDRHGQDDGDHNDQRWKDIQNRAEYQQ